MPCMPGPVFSNELRKILSLLRNYLRIFLAANFRKKVFLIDLRTILKARSHSALRLYHGQSRQKVVSREADDVVRVVY